MTPRTWLLAAALAALAPALAPAPAALAAGADLALVIGNNRYASAPPAETARRDAELVARALEEAGYEVTLGIDLDRAEMRAAIGAFAALAAEDPDRVVIYVSGHALRTGGQSYLAPVDASARSLTDVLFDGVPLDLLLRIAAAAPGRSAVFVDAAQLAGFTPTTFAEPGLAPIAPPEGVMVVSAAPPGRAIRRSSHRDSRFAQIVATSFLSPGAVLAEAVAEAGAPVWSAGAAEDGFALVDLPETALTDPADIALQVELAFWRSAEASGRREDYQAYLRRYPDGAFAAIARNRVGAAALPTPTPVPPAVDPDQAAEAALNLSRADRRDAQLWLTALGFDTRGADGVLGRNSRDALGRWQVANGFRRTGYLTAAQVALLARQGRAALAEQARLEEERRRQAEARDAAFWAETGAAGTRAGLEAYLAAYPNGTRAAEARASLDALAAAASAEEAEAAARREDRAWRRAEAENTADGYRDFLARFPEGRFAAEALARIDAIEGTEQAEAAAREAARVEAALGLGPYDIVSLEQRLAFLGFSAGPQDGTLDRQARQAIAEYQQSRRLEATGYLDRPTVIDIVQETGGPGRAGQIDGAAVLRGILEAITR